MPADEPILPRENSGSPADGKGLDETLAFHIAKVDGSTESGRCDDAFPIGKTLAGRYRLKTKLGEGGFGMVFLGEDIRLNREVAIKLIRGSLWNSRRRFIAEDEFESEAKLGAALVHPAIAVVHDYGLHDSSPFTVFEFVPGESLSSRIKQHSPMLIDDVASLIAQLAAALDYAHDKGIVHRDLKPDNIRIDENGRPKILDFGLAKRFLTHNDWSFAGTPAYASPEQIREEPSDGRTDQYALGLITYELLTGQRPFSARTRDEMFQAHCRAEVKWPEQFNVAEVAQKAVNKALSKKPHERFASCTEFAIHFGCSIEVRKAKLVNFQMESPVKLSSFGFLPNHAYIGLLGYELWICSNDSLYIVNVEGLRTATAEVPRLTGPGILGRPVFGTTLEPQYQAAMSLSTGGGWWQPWKNTLPFSITSLEFPSKAVAKKWSTTLQPICKSGADSLPSGKCHIEKRPPTVLTSSPDANVQVIGPSASSAADKRTAILKLRLQAAVNQADCLVDFKAEKLVTPAGVLWNVQGIAGRSTDSETRDEFALREYGQRAWRLAAITIGYVAIALVLRIGLLTVVGPLTTKFSILGVSLQAAMLLYAIPPVGSAALVIWIRWPQFLKPLAGMTIAWALFPALCMLGYFVADWNNNPAIEALHDTLKMLRKVRKLEAACGGAGIILAIQLAIAFRRVDLVRNDLLTTAPHRKVAQVLFWTLVAAYVVLPVIALGWGIRAVGP